MNSVLEIRSYTVKAGRADEFAHLMKSQSLPLLKAAGTNVVGFRPSLHAPDAFVLMRAYRDVGQRSESQDQFYGSDAWRYGPREAVLDCIDTYTSIVIDADDYLLAGLRRNHVKG